MQNPALGIELKHPIRRGIQRGLQIISRAPQCMCHAFCQCQSVVTAHRQVPSEPADGQAQRDGQQCNQMAIPRRKTLFEGRQRLYHHGPVASCRLDRASARKPTHLVRHERCGLVQQRSGLICRAVVNGERHGVVSEPPNALHKSLDVKRARDPTPQGLPSLHHRTGRHFTTVDGQVHHHARSRFCAYVLAQDQSLSKRREPGITRPVLGLKRPRHRGGIDAHHAQVVLGLRFDQDQGTVLFSAARRTNGIVGNTQSAHACFMFRHFTRCGLTHEGDGLQARQHLLQLQRTDVRMQLGTVNGIRPFVIALEAPQHDLMREKPVLKRIDNALGRAVECGIAPGLHLPALILPVKHRERQEHEADGGPCQSGKAPIPMLGAKASEEVRREHREEASGPEREPEKQGRPIIDALPTHCGTI